jgi:hypothetical protein
VDGQRINAARNLRISDEMRLDSIERCFPIDQRREPLESLAQIGILMRLGQAEEQMHLENPAHEAGGTGLLPEALGIMEAIRQQRMDRAVDRVRWIGGDVSVWQRIAVNIDHDPLSCGFSQVRRNAVGLGVLAPCNPVVGIAGEFIACRLI